MDFFFFWVGKKKKSQTHPRDFGPRRSAQTLQGVQPLPQTRPPTPKPQGAPTARSLPLRPRRPHPPSRWARARALWAVATHATGRAAAARTSRAHVAPLVDYPPRLDRPSRAAARTP